MNAISQYFTVGSYHGSDVNSHSVASDERPITVNCAGRIVTGFPFTTDNPTGRNDYYLLYMLRGKMELSAGALKKSAESGDLFLIPPHTHYTYVYSGGEPLEYLWTHFTGSYAEGLLLDCGLSPLPYCGCIDDGGRISGKFKKMLELFEERTSLLERRTAVYLEQIILDIAENILSKEEKIPLGTSLRYIHSAYNQKLSVPQLAKMENLSNSRYVSLFKQLTGLSPTAYIIKLRTDTACELLATTDMSVKQVGILVGYDDPHFFCKLFKKHVGLSPNEYRRTK